MKNKKYEITKKSIISFVFAVLITLAIIYSIYYFFENYILALTAGAFISVVISHFLFPLIGLSTFLDQDEKLKKKNNKKD